MAYAATVKWKFDTREDGRRRIRISVSETEAGSSSAWCTKNGAISGVTVQQVTDDGTLVTKDLQAPTAFRVSTIRVKSTEGTINPALGSPSTPGSFNIPGSDLLYLCDDNADRPSNFFAYEFSAAVVGFPPDRLTCTLSGMSQASISDSVNWLIVLEEAY